MSESVAGFEKGTTFDVSTFAVGDTISVSAVSKGKGFQGVVKRHGFHGGPGSHGMKNTHRTPGSIGATGPQRVFKGTRMAGRMGSDRITVKNLTVLAIDPKENILLVSGAVPGRRGTLVEVRSV
jgi:large subunit ribosomal protein L3